MAIALFIYSMVNVLVKHTIDLYPVWQLVFFRVALVSIPASIWLAKTGQLNTIKTKQFKLYLVLGITVSCMFYMLFTGFRALPLANAATLAYSSILFVTVFSYPLLGERVNIKQVVAILIGFIGVIIIANPHKDFDVANLYPLGFAFGDGLMLLLTRYIAKFDSAPVITIFFSLVASIFSGIMMIPTWVWPTTNGWIMLTLFGIGAGIGQLFMTQAFREAPAVVVAPMIYTGAIWGVVLGYFAFNEVPQLHFWVGAAVLIASGLYLIMNERQVNN